MSARSLIAAASLGISLAALIARTVAGMLDAAVRELGSYQVEVPSTVPEWMNEEADLS